MDGKRWRGTGIQEYKGWRMGNDGNFEIRRREVKVVFEASEEGR